MDRSADPSGREDIETAAPSFADGWRVAGPLIVVGLLGALAIHFVTVTEMAETWWNSKTFNHAFLIAPISGYLIWTMRDGLSQISPRTFLWGLLPLAAAAVLWLLGEIAMVLVVQEFALVLMLQAMVLTILGVRIARFLIFPLGYLLFAVPFGEFLTAPLQDITAEFLVFSLQVIGIPVFHDGVFISIPSGNFEVAEACAGLRFLVATIALGFLFAQMTFRSRKRQAVFIGLCFVIPIAANGLRALGIVLLAYYSNNKIAVGVDHIVYGWGFFAFITLILLFIGSKFSDVHLPAAAPTPAQAASANGQSPSTARDLYVAGALALAVVGGAPILAAAITDDGARLSNPLAVPSDTGPWTLSGDDPGTWHPEFLGADAELLERFDNGSKTLLYYVGYYSRQTQDAELINQGNSFEPDNNWMRAGGGRTDIIVDGQNLRAQFTRLLGGRSTRVVVYWYWVDGQFTGDTRTAKLLHLKASLLGGQKAAAVVAVAADYDMFPKEAFGTIQEFLDQTPGIADSLSRPVELER